MTQPTIPFSRIDLASLALLLSFLALMTLVCTASAQSPPTPMQQKYLKKLGEPIILRGDYFRAVMAAYNDFRRELSKNESAATAPNTPNRELATWLSKIENYDIRVSEKAGVLYVNFMPTVRGDFLPVLGGGAHYEIDAASYEIRSKSFSK